MKPRKETMDYISQGFKKEVRNILLLSQSIQQEIQIKKKIRTLLNPLTSEARFRISICVSCQNDIILNQ